MDILHHLQFLLKMTTTAKFSRHFLIQLLRKNLQLDNNIKLLKEYPEF